MAHPVSHRSVVSLLAAWLALVLLATLSLAVPAGGAPLAIAVAVVKAAIVAGVFMHLARGPRRDALAFAIGLAFFVLLVVGVAADVEFR